LTLLEIGTLLARSYGTCGIREGVTVRAVPSGGGLYPLDLYLLQFADEPFDGGAYHYHAGRHVLQRTTATQCSRESVASTSIYPQIVGEAGIVFVIVADMERSRVKYGERSYRLVLLEAGHVSQNLYLIASVLGLGIVALDGFYDDRLHELLDVDGVNEIALLSFAIGRRP
jgi:SagB-type dehydrogenase family enzyme